MTPRLPPRPCPRVFTGLLLVTVIASLAANLALFRGLKHFYTRELLVRLRPVGGGHIVRAGDPAGPRILFLGDSRAADWPALSDRRLFNINAGAPGETTEQIRLRTEALLLAEKPSVVIVQAGINDLKAIGVLPGSADDIRRKCAANLGEIAQLCRRRHARVVLTLVLPPGKVPWWRRPFWSAQIQSAVNEVNDNVAHEFAGVREIAVLDLEQILGSKPGDPRDYRGTLHLTPAAYAKFEPVLLRLLDGWSPSIEPMR
jgi:lysophospholipase L1-like esterase